MSAGNLSAWALTHKSFVGFVTALVLVSGFLSYRSLGRDEDPPFTFRVMVVSASWPGATAEETAKQVTERLEKALQSLQWLDNISSYTKPGETTLKVELKGSTPPRLVPEQWYQVRKKIGDIRHTLPQGTVGPFFNDEFGDVYGLIYAFTSDGFSFRQLRDRVEDVRSELLRVPGVGKVDLVGVQNEIVYVDFSIRSLADRGIDPDQLAAALAQQNAVLASGVIETSRERIAVRVSGGLDSARSVEQLSIRVNNRLVRLRDVALVRRGYEDPPTMLFRFNGEPAIGLGVSMTKGGNILDLGVNVEAAMRRIVRDLPLGIEPHLVANQPRVVRDSVGEFTEALMESIGIVLLVSFISLGLRAGLVVAIGIPAVLALTFVVMGAASISLQRISLGALVIALGLLVDDEMIAVEMMVRKLEEGWDRFKAATFAYQSTAFPMLTGTLVTVAGFLPVGLAKSTAGEYTFTLFAVVAIALLASWWIAVFVTPYIGNGVLRERTVPHGSATESRFAARFRQILLWALMHRRVVVLATVVLFAISVVAFSRVEQQFFPSSNRPELLLSMTLPHRASIRATIGEVDRLEKILVHDPDIAYHSFYVGAGAIRFFLPLNVQLENPEFAQAVIVTKGYAVRDRVRARLRKVLNEQFAEVLARVEPLQMGPPVDWPIQYRVGGSDPVRVRSLAEQIAGIMKDNPNVHTINFDWHDMGRSVLVNIDQEKARVVGLTSAQVAATFSEAFTGLSATQLRDDIYLVDVRGRATAEDRTDIQTLRQMQLRLPTGTTLPLAQVATFAYGIEDPVVWRRDRLPTITVQSEIGAGIQPATVNGQLDKALESVKSQLPPGYRLEVGGALAESAKGQSSVVAVVPVMLVVMLVILIAQLQSVQKLVIVMLTAPLGIIGVAWALLLSGRPFGFVAMLGTFALTGMIIRNSVVLIAQIQDTERAGIATFDAIVEATVHRLRPILLTATAAILGMIPIAGQVFWGPMAFALMGGLAIATVLTLIFLPALYAMWFRATPQGEKAVLAG